MRLPPRARREGRSGVGNPRPRRELAAPAVATQTPSTGHPAGSKSSFEPVPGIGHQLEPRIRPRYLLRRDGLRPVFELLIFPQGDIRWTRAPPVGGRRLTTTNCQLD